LKLWVIQDIIVVCIHRGIVPSGRLARAHYSQSVLLVEHLSIFKGSIYPYLVGSHILIVLAIESEGPCGCVKGYKIRQRLGTVDERCIRAA
jgi:hypothetical protein